MANPGLSPATASRLRSLRLRVTALIALLATVAVTVFAVVVIRIDRQLRNEQAETELLRLTDDTARQVTFEGGELQAEDLALGGTVIAISPSFDVDAFAARSEALDLPSPDEDDISRLVRAIYAEAGREGRAAIIGLLFDERGQGLVADAIDYDELLDDGVTEVERIEIEEPDGDIDVFGPTELVLTELEDQLAERPPADLFDEAYRRFVEEAADEADVELEFETEYLGADTTTLSEASLFVAADEVIESPGEAYVDTVVDPDGRTFRVRSIPLRDGPEVRGAVIAVLDPSEFDDAHTDLRNQIVLLALLIVAGSIVAAWFVAARTITPTARALAQQERFLADAAHELRTPIAAIRLTAESAKADTAADNLARVAELAADASTLTDDLLTLARMDADRMELQREPVRLDLLVESTIAAIPGADGALQLSGTDTVIEADPRLVERAIGNLVRNAMAHGGATAEAPATVVIESSGDGAIVTVRDHGPGLDDDVAAELFERFRSRTGSRGHGLGLPLARWIARAHGGDLRVESPPGGGAAFVLTLPS